MPTIKVTAEKVQRDGTRSHTFPSPVSMYIVLSEHVDITARGTGASIYDTETDTEYWVTDSLDSVGKKLALGTPITFADSANLDAFARLRVSNPETLFDSKNIFDDPDIANTEENIPLFYDNQETAGGGTSTSYVPNESAQYITVTDDTIGTRVRQTKMRFNYQPGKSQMVLLTFNLYGASTSDISIITRSSASGAPVDTEIPQADWNIDPLDGTGASGVTLDVGKTNILFMDYEWLGVGRQRIGFVINGIPIYVHEFNNANNLDVVYMQTPNLPLRSEISSDGAGVYTKREGLFDDNNGMFLQVIGGENTISQICSTVISEGGSQDIGVVRSANTAGTHIDANVENTFYAVLGLKLKANYLAASIRILKIALQEQAGSKKLLWSLRLNPTVAGTFTYLDKPQSALQVATGALANTVTGGYEIDSDFFESGGVQAGSAGSSGSGIQNAVRLGSLIDGTPDEIVLCVAPVGGTTLADVEGSITWRELT